MGEGSLDLKDTKLMTPTKMLVESKSLIQVLTRNVLLPRMSLSFWFYLARWIFQAVWYNQFSPFSLVHAVLTNSTSALRKFYLDMLMTERGTGSLWAWAGLVSMWYRSHTENGLSPKQGEMLQWVASIQKPHAQQHSAPERHRRETLFKGGDMETTNPSCSEWTPGSFWPHSR